MTMTYGVYCLIKIIFENLLKRNACEIKFFSSICQKMEKLKLSLSKQHNKMLKTKSEMLKIIKNVKIIKLEKIFRESFRKFPESQ